MSYLRFTIRKYTEEMDNMTLLSNQSKRKKKSHNIAVSDTLWPILAEKCILSEKLHTYMCMRKKERQRRKISAK